MLFQSTSLPDLLWGWVMAQENAGLASKRFRYGIVVDQFTKEIIRLYHASGSLMHRCHDNFLALRFGKACSVLVFKSSFRPKTPSVTSSRFTTEKSKLMWSFKVVWGSSCHTERHNAEGSYVRITPISGEIRQLVSRFKSVSRGVIDTLFHDSASCAPMSVDVSVGR